MTREEATEQLTPAYLPTILTAIRGRFLAFHGGLATPCRKKKRLAAAYRSLRRFVAVKGN